MSRSLLLIPFACLLLWMPQLASAQEVITEEETTVGEEERVERDMFSIISADVGAPKALHLRTNLVYDAVLLPSLGIEFSSGGDWTFLLEGCGNWIDQDKKHRYWRFAQVSFECRAWTSAYADAILHRGHHLGFYVAAYRYDIEFGGKGQMADFNYGGGFAWGYSAPIGRKLSFDFSLSVGYIGGKYIEYRPIDSHYVWQGDKHRFYIGPTKAEIALVWHIEFKKKGGVQW